VGRTALAAVLVASGALALGCGDAATQRPAAAPPRHASIANTLLVGRGDGAVRLLSIRGMGSFSVSCAHGLPKVGFRAGGGATLHATVDGSGPLRSAFLSPGRALAPRAKGRVLAQHWQLGVATEARADVVTVSISAARASAVGNPGCQAAGHATVDRGRRSNRPPSG
jgi:hypothetical protein